MTFVQHKTKGGMKSIVEQIHEEFNTSQSKLLMNKPNASAECLYKLGFIKSKSSEDYYINNHYYREIAAYFQKVYPNYRYITEKQVEIICNKYGLLCTTVDRYIGEVPMSKVAAMTSFRIKKGDVYVRWMSEFGIQSQPKFNGRGFSAFSLTGHPEEINKDELVGAHDLWICAPESDIDTTGLERAGHNIAQPVKDPVVLQPVNEGFLIVAAWGDEASDENVVNHKMN